MTLETIVSEPEAPTPKLPREKDLDDQIASIVILDESQVIMNSTNKSENIIKTNQIV